MANKDKFKQMQQGGGKISSFQDIVQQAATVAAIEKQAEHGAAAQTVTVTPTERVGGAAQPAVASDTMRFMRLPNPQIPMTEYNLVTRYCEQFSNMTRQDFVELAIVEKLHADGGLSKEDFNKRYDEIRNRPPRGYRKGTKNPPVK